MRRVCFPLIYLLILISCMPKNNAQNYEAKDCCMIIIDCPTQVKAGNTVTIKAILYDSDNERIVNTRSIRPNWLIDNNNVMLIKDINGDECRIKAVNPGTCHIKVMQDKAIATTEISVLAQ